jgi:hypothetical protein
MRAILLENHSIVSRRGRGAMAANGNGAGRSRAVGIR